jgi:hypothetical protein
MSDDDKFFEKLRVQASPLRYEPDPASLERIRARIQERIAEPQTVAALLAAWFRPLAAALTAVAILAAIGLATIDTSDPTALTPDRVEIVVAGDSYVVGD